MASQTTTASETTAQRAHPATWVPTLYFAEGLPYFAVNFMALIFYQEMGVRNAVTTAVVSLLAWPWTLKPIWSPLIEMYGTKKLFVVLTQLVGGVGLVLLALSLPLPGYFRWSVAILAVLAFASSTHDIAADGLYIASLSQKEQAEYVGWQGAFYNGARLFSMGALIWTLGKLQKHFAVSGSAAPVAHAWLIIFAGLGVLLVVLALYHSRMLPRGGERRRTETLGEAARTFRDVVVTLFRKPGIWVLLVFIFLARAGEGQVTKVGPLFLKGARAAGGLGLTNEQFSMTYGIFGAIAFILGSVLGGYFAARFGLKRALLPLMLILNLPMLAYWYLSATLPATTVATRAGSLPAQLLGWFESLTGVPAVITAALSLEMLGYGFGFVGIILLMMQEIAPGKYQTAHYAFANSLMNLGVILPGAVSGWIQTQLGYRNFFVWVVLASIPALVLSRFIPIRGGAEQAPSPAAAAPAAS
jgi:MFS transporter, PAT family, beta-lactamase induction signal transducer AmpG